MRASLKLKVFYIVAPSQARITPTSFPLGRLLLASTLLQSNDSSKIFGQQHILYSICTICYCSIAIRA